MVISISIVDRTADKKELTHGEKMYPYEVIFNGNRLFKNKEEAIKFKEELCKERLL